MTDYYYYYIYKVFIYYCIYPSVYRYSTFDSLGLLKYCEELLGGKKEGEVLE